MDNANLEYRILEELASSQSPIGASLLALKIDGISPATIGRVLQSMEYEGLIKKASNKGRLLTSEGESRLTILRDKIKSSENATELLNLIFTPQDIKVYIDILEARILLEKETVSRAAQKITDGEIKELESLLARQAEKQDRGEMGEEENLRFHYRIAEIADNKIIEQLLKIIMTQKAAYLHFSIIHYRLAMLGNSNHFQILDAIRNHDPQRAAKEMESHLSALLNYSIKMEDDTMATALRNNEEETGKPQS